MGLVDRIIRFTAIDLLLGFSFMGYEISMMYATIAFVLSAVLALGILLAYSPVYHYLGISTLEN